MENTKSRYNQLIKKQVKTSQQFMVLTISISTTCYLFHYLLNSLKFAFTTLRFKNDFTDTKLFKALNTFH